jgi:peptide/nickel transport system permease protein
MIRRLAAAALLCGAVLSAPLVAPHDPDEIVDVRAARHLAPGSEVRIVSRPDGTRFIASPDGPLPGSISGDARVQRRRHLLGTDAFGRDLLSRILHGARFSMGVTVLAVALGMLLGVAAGSIAGYLGGPADLGLVWLMDVLHAVPRIFLFLLCAALFGPSAALVAIVLGITGWPGIARITRSRVLSVRESGFTAAARALGATRPRILLRHVLPSCAAPVAVAAVLLAADTLLAESALSFLGIGIQPPQASLGSLIAGGRHGFSEAWWVVVFPGLSILATVLLLHTLARPRGARTSLLP